MKTYTALSLSFASTLLALLPVANAEGCYTGGGIFGAASGANFKFGHLHNSPDDYANQGAKEITNEVYWAIESVCNMVDGAAVKAGSSWSRCENWEYLRMKPCPDGVGGCYASDVGYDHLPGNQLDFEIKHDGDGDETRTLTADVCNAAFVKQFDECNEFGGEHSQDGFWFRLDPNPHTC